MVSATIYCLILIDVHVLLTHAGKHTILDHYTFKWTDGRMALALGLGVFILQTNAMFRR